MQYALIRVILKNGIRKNLLYHEDTDGVINNILGTSYKLALLGVFLNKTNLKTLYNALGTGYKLAL